MTDRSTSASQQSASDRLLWFGVAAGPAAWSLLLLVSYAMAEFLVCDVDYRPAVLVLAVIAGLTAIAGGFAAWRAWQQLGDDASNESDAIASRQGFMAISGVSLSVLTLIGIVYLVLPMIWIEPCA